MTPLHFTFPRRFADPRLQPGFQPEHYPLCGGLPAPPPGTPDLHGHRCLEFLAVYYHINTLQARILDSPEDGAADRLLLAEALERLEILEDHYAPIGFHGEAVMDGIFYGDIHFSRPSLFPDAKSPQSISSHIAIPELLTELPLSEFRGPAILTRWSHGETDS